MLCYHSVDVLPICAFAISVDHSRVKLIPLDDDDQCSDYINANYMPVCTQL